MIYLSLRSYDISFESNISFINLGFKQWTDLKTSLAMVLILHMCNGVYPHLSKRDSHVLTVSLNIKRKVLS